MKRILLVPDGAADLPHPDLDGRTPLEVARTPFLDQLAEGGRVGAVQVTPPDMYPGSDAANMALLGYDPVRYYTGRGPIEAAAMEIPLEPRDVAFRCSLITTDGTTLLDYSAGHISTEEARTLVELADQKLGTRSLRLFPGVQYRHILRWTDGPVEVRTAAPHESMDRPLAEIYPVGDGEAKLRTFIDDSVNLLDDHPINRRRRADGLPPANTLWPWSPGRSPRLPAFAQVRGVTGAVISAVDVVRGLGRLTGLEVVRVPGATGYFDTDYAAKGRYALAALERHEFVWVHVESPDEAGHAGSLDEKIRGIENFDRHIAGAFVEGLRGSEYRLLCAPDHMTPVSTRGHAVGPVPYLLFDSRRVLRTGLRQPFDERAVQDARAVVPEGWSLMDDLFAD